LCPLFTGTGGSIGKATANHREAALVVASDDRIVVQPQCFLDPRLFLPVVKNPGLHPPQQNVTGGLPPAGTRHARARPADNLANRVDAVARARGRVARVDCLVLNTAERGPRRTNRRERWYAFCIRVIARAAKEKDVMRYLALACDYDGTLALNG